MFKIAIGDQILRNFCKLVRVSLRNAYIAKTICDDEIIIEVTSAPGNAVYVGKAT